MKARTRETQAALEVEVEGKHKERCLQHLPSFAAAVAVSAAADCRQFCYSTLLLITR